MLSRTYETNGRDQVGPIIERRRSDDRGSFSEAIFFGFATSVFGGLLWAFRVEPIAVVIFGVCTFATLCKLCLIFKRMLLPYESVLNINEAGLCLRDGRGLDGSYFLSSAEIAKIYFDQGDRTIQLISTKSKRYLLTEYFDWHDGSVIRFREFVLSRWPWVEVWVYHNDWNRVSA